jgi:integrase/recombinase XerD
MSRRGHYLKHRKPSAHMLPEHKWPADDRVRWAAVQHRGDALETGGRAAYWKPRTVRNVLQSYGHWLKWLSDHHVKVMRLGPMERVTRENVRLYIEYMQSRALSPFTIQLNLQRLGQMMVAFTETKEFGWLFRAANRLKPRSVRDKRSKMQPSYQLAELGHRLMLEAQGLTSNWHRHRSVRFRNGLIIALLAYRPVRLANLAGIVIDQHLIRSGDTFVLKFGADETKQGEELGFELPQILTEPLSQYLAEHRPALLNIGSHAGSAGQYLWVARDGGHLTSAGISQLIVNETKAAFGASINPHLFRDCAATTIAIDDPEHAHIIAPILGHGSITTSERHYNQAKTVDAGRQYHKTLKEVRARPRSRRSSPVGA